jgi:hypothetical protein
MLKVVDWYEKPTQVIFIPVGECPCVGIAYRDEIICLCCGGVYDLNECLIAHEYEWISLHEECVGDDEHFDEIYSEWNELDSNQLYEKYEYERYKCEAKL